MLTRSGQERSVWTFARPYVDIHPVLIDKAESAIQINLLSQRVQYAETTTCGAGGTQCRQYHLRFDSLLSHFRERRHILETGDGKIAVGAEQTDFYLQILGNFSGGAIKARKKPSNLRRMIELNVADMDDKVAAIDAMKEYWVGAFLPALHGQKIYTPKMSARNGEAVGSDTIQRKACISADPRAHVQFANQYIDLGFTDLDFHRVGEAQRAFVEGYARDVFPEIRQLKAQRADWSSMRCLTARSRQTKGLPSKEAVRLENEESLFPVPDETGQEDEPEALGLREGGLYFAVQDDELLAE